MKPSRTESLISWAIAAWVVCSRYV